MTVTFKNDCLLEHKDSWISKGTKVKVVQNEFFGGLDGFLPVIITEAYDYYGKPVKINPTIEYFSCDSFMETI